MLNSVHFFGWESYVENSPGYAACGVFTFRGEDKSITKKRKNVTCNNCRRTRIFKEKGKEKSE